MKESGLNYFMDQVGLNTGDIRVLYTFEDGVGSTVSSVPLGQSLFNGTLSSVGQFWSKPGSGFFSGNSVTVGNASGLASQTFTHMIAFEKVNASGAVLLSNLNGSGYRIGLTDTNKLYFEASPDTTIVAASTTNLSSKNLVSVAYVNNSVSFGYYDWNQQTFNTESYNLPFGTLDSDTWSLGASFTGYMDYYLYFSTYLNGNALSQIASGLYNVVTGSGLSVQTVCNTQITGYLSIPFFITGVTGYQMTNGAGVGNGQFASAFPNTATIVTLTGIINSGVVQSGLTGLVCYSYTGNITPLFSTNTPYASGYGMEKIVLMRHVVTGEILKLSTAALYSRGFNREPNYLVSGFDNVLSYTTGEINLFRNGVFVENTGFAVNGRFMRISGATSEDTVTFDLFSGVKYNLASVAGIAYTGQEVYMNGVNLISGQDFTVTAGVFALTTGTAGLFGTLMVSPIGLPSITGLFEITGLARFARGTSNLYRNGIRQHLGVDYIEAATFDRYTANFYDENGNFILFSGVDENWD